jgi:hypothetical protein
VLIGERGRRSAGNVGYATFLDWRERSHSFDAIALIRSWAPTLIADGEAERISGMRVSANFFRTSASRRRSAVTSLPPKTPPLAGRSCRWSDGVWRRSSAPIRDRRTRDHDERAAVHRRRRDAGVVRAADPERFYKRAEVWALVGYDASQPFACRTCQHPAGDRPDQTRPVTLAARADVTRSRPSCAASTPRTMHRR